MAAVECPQCHTINEVEFGLTPCANCGLMLIEPDEAESPAPDSNNESLEVEEIVEFDHSNDPAIFTDLTQPEIVESDEDPPAVPQTGSENFLPDEFIPEPTAVPEAPTMQSIVDEMNETSESGWTSDLPFSYQVVIHDLDLPERMKLAFEIVRDPSLHIQIEEAVEIFNGNEVTVVRLNAFQASSILRALLRASFRVNWKQVF